MIARYFTSVSLGAGVTFCLLFLMQHLISMGEEVFTPSLPPPVTIVKIGPEEPIKTTRELPKPPDERPLPPPREFPPHDGDPRDGPVVLIDGPLPVIDSGKRPIAGYGNSGDLLPIVVASSSSIFDRAALEAAYKFKYKPRVVDGQPVESPGVQRKFTLCS